MEPRATLSRNALLLLATVVTGAIARPLLVKRARWAFMHSGGKNAVVMATVWAGVAAVLCAGSAGVGCVVSFAIAGIATAVSLAGDHVQTGATTESKRSLTGSLLQSFKDGSVDNNTLSLPIPNGLVTLVAVNATTLGKRDSLASIGLRLLALGDLVINGTNTGPSPIILCDSDQGNHLIMSVSLQSHDDLINAVIDSKTSGIFDKRDDAVYVSWLSYNFEETDATYAGGWLNDENNYSSAQQLASEMWGFLSSNPSPKYCAAAQWGDNADRYDDIGRDNVVKGEIYFNSYGGIDGQCGESKDGVDD